MLIPTYRILLTLDSFLVLNLVSFQVSLNDFLVSSFTYVGLNYSGT